MKVVGITKIRNEAHIIQDTLDSWAHICDVIHVYDDCSQDDTPRICREHPKVKEVITSNFFDPDRERAEWFNRQVVWSSARRFMGPDDWVVYFDGDEHLYGFDPDILENPRTEVVACPSYDAYITAEDAHIDEWHYKDRLPWVSREYEFCLYFYRNRPWLNFHLPDQRNMMDHATSRARLSRPDTIQMAGKILHWGKGLSVKKWEEKCGYYSQIFGPKYAEKWENRKGRAIHHVSDFGLPLVKWTDVKTGKVETFNRKRMPLVS